MVGVHPKAQNHVTNICRQIRERKPINDVLKDIKDFDVVVEDYQIKPENSLSESYKEINKLTKSLGNRIKKNEDGYLGALIVPEHLNTGYRNYSLLNHMSWVISEYLSDNSNGVYITSFFQYPNSGSSDSKRESKIPKLKIISFFRK